jgi:hypothetical protein
MDHREVSELADELAQVTCRHLPWSDQRVIALELGVGECDLASCAGVAAGTTGTALDRLEHHCWRCVSGCRGRTSLAAGTAGATPSTAAVTTMTRGRETRVELGG